MRAVCIVAVTITARVRHRLRRDFQPAAALLWSVVGLAVLFGPYKYIW